MKVSIRHTKATDIQIIQSFTVKAFEPIFASFKAELGQEIFGVLYPDWRQTQRDLVHTLFEDTNINTWVAVLNEQPVGYIATQVNEETKIGEIPFVVVDTSVHQQGIGLQLTDYALQQLSDAGMLLAEVATGGDPSHAPARALYEKSGFTRLPLALYLKRLSG